MRRTLLTTFLFFPILSSAMGLGTIKVDSYLGQPLSAEIPLLYAQGVTLGDIQAAPAPESAYLQAGVTPPQDIPGLAMTIKQDKQNNPVLIVTTTDSVKEPVVTFMLELSWPGGNVFREYTVMLDPPTLVAAGAIKDTTPVVTSKSAQEILPSQINSITAVSTPALVAASASAPVNEKTASYGPTKSGESLQAIAQKVRSSSVSVDQMMIAIANKNPSAFTKNNINGLETKRILTLPTSAEIQQLSAKSAQNAVIVQNQQWHGNKHSQMRATGQMISVLPSVSFVSAAPSEQTTQTTPTVPSSADLSLEKNTNMQLLANNSTSAVTDAKETTIQVPKDDSALQNKLALAITTVDSLEEQQHLIQMHDQDLQRQTQNLQQQLSSREQTIVSLQAEVAQLSHHSANATLQLEQQMSTGFSSGASFLNKVPVLDWLALFIFISLLSVMTWLVLKLKQTQQLLLEKIKLNLPDVERNIIAETQTDQVMGSKRETPFIATSPADITIPKIQNLQSEFEQQRIINQEKLDLAETYITMKDFKAAEALLQDIFANGLLTQQEKAKRLLQEIL